MGVISEGGVGGGLHVLLCDTAIKFLHVEMPYCFLKHAHFFIWNVAGFFPNADVRCILHDLFMQPAASQKFYDLFMLLLRTEEYFRILIKSNWNQTVFIIIRLIGTKRTSVWFHINRKMVNTIWFLFDLIRFRKLCVYTDAWLQKHKFAVGETIYIQRAMHIYIKLYKCIATVSIMGTQFRAPLEPRNTIMLWGSRRALNSMMPRRNKNPHFHFLFAQWFPGPGNTTKIRRTVVRETCISRLN